MSSPREILLADADVLIDYVGSDPSVLGLVSEHVGDLFVLAQILRTVRSLSARECKQHRIQVVEADTETLIEAGSRSGGALSFDDWLCVSTCRYRSWTCVSNDRVLLRECRKARIRVRRGLGLMVDLVRTGIIPVVRAQEVAAAMQERNPHHINGRVIEAFHRAIGAP